MMMLHPQTFNLGAEVRLPILDSLNGGTTRRAVLAPSRVAIVDLVDRTHERVDPNNAAQSLGELCTPAQRFYSGRAPGRAVSADWQVRQ